MSNRIPEKIYYEAEVESYNKDPRTKLDDGFTLLMQSPTLKAYKHDKNILIAIRGTDPFDKEDLKADALIAINKLSSSERVKKDEAFMKKILNRYRPDHGFNYFLTGHSLGGAILLLFIKLYPFIKAAVAYNSALQPQDLIWQPGTNTEEKYTSRDPLFKIMGHFLRHKQVINVPETYNLLQAHGLSAFENLYK